MISSGIGSTELATFKVVLSTFISPQKNSALVSFGGRSKITLEKTRHRLYLDSLDGPPINLRPRPRKRRKIIVSISIGLFIVLSLIVAAVFITKKFAKSTQKPGESISELL
jgi:hypothetical protein